LDAAGIYGDAAVRKQNGKQRVLITGAGGSVGGWAVQLAALAGAGIVVAVCGPDKEAMVKQLGATEVLNYRETSVREWATAGAGRQVDLVVDCIGAETLAGCWIAVKEDGALISVNTPPDMVKPAGLNKKLAKNLFFIVDPYGKNLEAVAALIEAGKVKPLVDSVWEMKDFEKAFERLQEGHAKGKSVIKISPEA
jgi:NADPH:quinone reductase-like Zn-dependent oxidoreductase